MPSRSWFAPLVLVVACQGSSPPADAGSPVDSAVSDAPTDRPGDAQAPPTGACERRTRAPSEAQASITRLGERVEVLRDAQGTPHLYARSDQDVLFAEGYFQARDRLMQMEFMRRTARGTAAEVFGRDKLSQDQLLRLMDLPRMGRESADRTRAEHPETFRLVDAWVGGVNRYIREVLSGAVPRPAGFRPGEYGFEPEPWTTDDPFTVARLLFFKNANQLEFDTLMAIMGTYLPVALELPITASATGAFAVPPEERPAPRTMARARLRAPGGRPARLAAAFRRWHQDLSVLRGTGSNNWAVAGRHSANGRPLIAGDPHQTLQSLPVFWTHHLNSADAGGTLDVVGFSFVGTPGVQLGHNRRVAWTATTTYPDFMDLFTVAYDERTIEVAGRRHPVARCTETIPVRGQGPVQYVVEDVPGLGVLLPRDFAPVPLTTGTDRVLLRYVGFGRGTVEADVFLAMDRARDVGDFEAQLRRMELGSFNFIAADARDIMYRTRTLVPDRGDPATFTGLPFGLLDGSDARMAWTGALLPDERMPHSRGGARGFLATANNDPFGFTANGRYDDDPWYFGAWFDPGTRAARIEQELARLTARGAVTPEEMQALQRDTYTLFADDLLPPLFEAFGRVDTDPALARYRGNTELTALVEALRAWDRRAEPEASAPVIYEGFAAFLGRALFADDLMLLFDPVASAAPSYLVKLSAMTIHRRYPQAERFMQGGRDANLLRALEDTRAWLASRFGGSEPSRYRWDQFHRTRFTVPWSDPSRTFDGGTALTAGSLGTVNVSEATFFGEMARPRMFHEAHGGSVYRMVAGFDEDGTPSAQVNLSRGNVGDPTSPLWANNQDDWVAGRYRPLPFRRAAVEAAARDRSTLEP
ncbi:MAG: penicillin acylase family protein [Deltaproteobacteria bacterium]|nr:penicillin acylase family protein [Deltaproteobacteria bacterium]